MNERFRDVLFHGILNRAIKGSDVTAAVKLLGCWSTPSWTLGDSNSNSAHPSTPKVALQLQLIVLAFHPGIPTHRRGIPHLYLFSFHGLLFNALAPNPPLLANSSTNRPSQSAVASQPGSLECTHLNSTQLNYACARTTAHLQRPPF